MSLSQFAAHIGSSVASVKRWESGSTVPSAAQREKLFAIVHAGKIHVAEPWRCHPGWWLRISRQRAGISIREAAKRAAISPSSWQRYESGESPVGRKQSELLVQWLSDSSPLLLAVQSSGTIGDFSHAEVLGTRDTFAACALIIQILLDQSSRQSEICPVEFVKMSAHGHALLGRFVMDLGDHDLAGQVYRAAAKLNATNVGSELNSAELKVGSVWAGFPTVKNPEIATKRLAWLDHQSSLLEGEDRANLIPVRSMFADWSGNPALARQILGERTACELTACSRTMIELMIAWHDSKYGNPLAALKQSEVHLADANPKFVFLARKVMLNAHFRSSQIKHSAEQMLHLKRMKLEHGLWAPDLDARARQITELQEPK